MYAHDAANIKHWNGIHMTVAVHSHFFFFLSPPGCIIILTVAFADSSAEQ